MSGKIIVIGNEKGGTGKSTLAMHLAVALLNGGKKVASVDLDGRQGTFTHYIENRVAFARASGLSLSVPEHFSAFSDENTPQKERESVIAALESELDRAQETYDAIVVDTAGAPSALSFAAHARADVLITPVNDSLVDFDMLAKVDLNTLTVKTPGTYAQTVWRARQKRASLKKPQMQWYVVRNRLPSVLTKNSRLLETLIEALGKRIAYTAAGGVKERLIYRELFLKGLTVLDGAGKKTGFDLTVSHVAARNEIRTLLARTGLSA